LGKIDSSFIAFVCKDKRPITIFFFIYRPLEDAHAERKYTSQGVLDSVLSQLDFTHTSEELLQAEVIRLEGR
jgi:hypothetical protein